MKTITAFVLLALSSFAAAKDFGGISFHSRLPHEQFNLLKRDLRYLFNLAPAPESELQRLTGLDGIHGPALHNFIMNRVRAVVGEDFSIQGSNLLQREGHAFPNTPLPVISSNSKSVIAETSNTTRITMSNLGSGLYLGGKTHQSLLGVRFDNKRLFATSPRVGIIQVGDGLFHSTMLVNRSPEAPANSISRLSTLLHEARHSDGTGTSTGFVHTMCPTGHALEGQPACDSAHNGPYRLGGLLERHLMNQCTSCSETEKTMLAASVSDNFSRVLRLTTTQEITQLRAILETYVNTRNLYREMLSSSTGERAVSIRTEIDKLTDKIRQTETRLIAAVEQLNTVGEVLWDATPEGQFTTYSLSTSSGLMRSSQGRP